MKKILILAIALVLTVALVACGGGDTTTAATTEGGGNTTTTKPDESTTNPTESTTQPPVTTTPPPVTTEGGTVETPSVKDMAISVIKTFKKAPDVWEFMPEDMGLESFVYEGTLPDFTANTAVNAIPDKMIGKQLAVVYSTFTSAQSTLSYVNMVYTGLSAIADLYQDFINKNPDNYKVFEGTWSIFGIRIELNEHTYTLLAKASGVTVELYSDLDNGLVSGRASVADKATVKFTFDDTSLRYAFSFGSLRTVDLQFIRNEDATVGYLYETTGVGDTRLTTSSLISITDAYTVIVGNKGDFIVPGQGINVEVYDSGTGKFIGSEVYETVKLVDYDTVWYPLTSITGIDSVKVVFDQSDKNNKLNLDTLYINGSSTPFKPVFNSVLGVKTSRQYDIEMKKVTVFTYDTAKEAYVENEIEIPMLFVQRDDLDTYLSDIKKENGLSATPVNTTGTLGELAISVAYTTHTEAYIAIKEAMTYEMTLAFIGTANAWFSAN